MKKGLLILSVLALGTVGLAGCEANGKIDKNLDQTYMGPEEYEGHKRVTKLKDGKEYYLGFYSEEDEMMRFMNGEPHTDEKGVYEYYCATTEGSFEDAATVEVNFVNDTEFTLQLHCDGAEWDEKYLSIYSAKAISREVMSIHLADEIDETFYDESAKEEKECIYNFTWLESYEEFAIYSLCAMYADDRFGDEEDMPHVFGSGYDPDGIEYISVDCMRADEMLDQEYTYRVAHFFEV